VSTKGTSLPTDRVALAIPEQRHALGLSLRELARASGVSRWTITKLERGGRVEPALVVKLAATLTVFELYAKPDLFEVDLAQVLALDRVRS
jgi:transcriptional regulator with XRE-family HTH domain